MWVQADQIAMLNAELAQLRITVAAVREALKAPHSVEASPPASPRKVPNTESAALPTSLLCNVGCSNRCL